MFNFFKGEQMTTHQEVVQNNNEGQESQKSRESIALAEEKIQQAINRFTQQA